MTAITFKFFCQNIIIDTLNNMDPSAAVTGYELGLKIEREMKLPEYMDVQTMALWAGEMDAYYRYAIEEFGTVTNPFNDRHGFFKECTGYNVRVIVSLCSSVSDRLNERFKVSELREQIIKEVMSINEVVLQEVY